MQYTEHLNDEVPSGFVILQRNPDRFVCLDNGRFHGWLMYKHPDGHLVSDRKLEHWELMQVEDQVYYDIVQEGGVHYND